MASAARPTSWAATLEALRERRAGLASQIGALALLVSALLTRGVGRFSAERDDASQPLLDMQVRERELLPPSRPVPRRGRRTLSDRRPPSLSDRRPPLLAQFGHCSQEVLNLLLLGVGVSNVFDGCRDLGGGFMLRGAPRQPPVGLLSELEALRYLQVGSHFKQPLQPIWVIASESHYSIMFALTATVQVMTAR